MTPPPYSILIVEDSMDDLFILKRAFRLAGTRNELCHAEDGQQAIEYLEKMEPAGGTNAPSLILLDLKLPRKNGLEVLEWLRQQPTLKGLVVVILTSSGEDRDISRAYDLGANAFLIKPASAEKMTEIVKALDLF